MAGITRFEEIDAWVTSRQLTNMIYSLSNQTAFSRDFGLRDQIRRASVSVMSNIAEGFERNGNIEFRQFLSTAKGSAGEARSQLYRVFDNDYINEETLNYLVIKYEKLSIKIHNFITYLNKKDFKGTKFIDPPS